VTKIDAKASEMCVPNLGPRQQRIRVVSGVVGTALALGIAAALIAFDAPRWSRLVLLLPIWGASIGFLQAREKT
jgi:hypothetical protein